MNIAEYPQEISPTGNPIVYVVGDSNYSESDFKFLCNIIVDGEETKLRKSPTKGQYMDFDISHIVENDLSYNFNADKPTYFYQESGAKEYEVQFGIFSGGTSYENLTSVTYVATNASLDRNDFLDYDYEDYLLHPESPFTGDSSKFGNVLTDYTTRNVSLLDKARIGIYNKGANTHTHIYIFTYENDLLSNVYRIHNPYVLQDQDDRIVIDFPAGPIDLNNSAEEGFVQSGFTTWSTYTGEVIKDTTDYYIIKPGYTNVVDTQSLTEPIRFNINKRCSAFDKINISWLNKYGSFDYFLFNMKFRESKNIERQEYTKKLGSLSGSKWSYTKNDFENINLLNSIDYEYIFSTDYITQEEGNMIYDMIESNVIYGEIDGEWVGIICNLDGINKKKINNRELIQYDITAKLNYKNNTIRL